ncbi:MAG: prolipoprotein diacylglyceryl transferase [Planctomycetota bacterium]|jgi:phosphatidylglycerol:prolipoprotein diacylglycerol transferase
MYPKLFTIPGINFPVPGYGAMVLIAFLGATFWMARRAVKVKADPDIILNLGFIILIFSAVGARTFYVVHRWDSVFAHDPAAIFNVRAGGFELYGGLIGAFIPCLLYLLYKRLSIRLYADIVAPSLLLGMGIGRIGCFLFGCCWGGPCGDHLPWAVEFPFASPPHQRQWENRLVTVPAELILIESSGTASPIPRDILALTPAQYDKLRAKLEEKASALADAEEQGDQKKIKRAKAEHQRLNEAAQSLFGHFERFDTTSAALCDLADNPVYKSLPVHPSQIYGAIGLFGSAFYRRGHPHRQSAGCFRDDRFAVGEHRHFSAQHYRIFDFAEDVHSLAAGGSVQGGVGEDEKKRGSIGEHFRLMSGHFGWEKVYLLSR